MNRSLTAAHKARLEQRAGAAEQYAAEAQVTREEVEKDVSLSRTEGYRILRAIAEQQKRDNQDILDGSQNTVVLFRAQGSIQALTRLFSRFEEAEGKLEELQKQTTG